MAIRSDSWMQVYTHLESDRTLMACCIGVPLRPNSCNCSIRPAVKVWNRISTIVEKRSSEILEPKNRHRKPVFDVDDPKRISTEFRASLIQIEASQSIRATGKKSLRDRKSFGNSVRICSSQASANLPVLLSRWV